MTRAAACFSGIRTPERLTRIGVYRHEPLPALVAVMLVTVVIVVATRHFSKGVLAGVLLSGIFFAAKVRRMFRVERESDNTRATYRATGHGARIPGSLTR